jgi:hypothetical protein
MMKRSRFMRVVPTTFNHIKQFFDLGPSNKSFRPQGNSILRRGSKVAHVLDALTRDHLARNIVCTIGADADTRVGKAPLLPSVAALRVFILAKIFSRSRSCALIRKCPSICPPFWVRHPREDFSIRFRRGPSYPVTTVSILG